MGDLEGTVIHGGHELVGGAPVAKAGDIDVFLACGCDVFGGFGNGGYGNGG